MSMTGVAYTVPPASKTLRSASDVVNPIVPRAVPVFCGSARLDFHNPVPGVPDCSRLGPEDECGAYSSSASTRYQYIWPQAALAVWSIIAVCPAGTAAIRLKLPFDPVARQT